MKSPNPAPPVGIARPLPTRRVFLRDLALAAAGAAVLPRFSRGAGEAGAPAQYGLAGLDRGGPLEERLRQMERYVHHRNYDPAGLMYSDTHLAEERPFRPSDFSARDSTMPGPEPSDWLNYENSAMDSGIFLASQCYRYRATRDPEALDYALRAFGSLDADYRLTEKGPAGGLAQKAGIIEMTGQRKGGGKGWFCKPYGSMATYQTSTEQNFHPVWGLYLYWGIAPDSVKPRIARMLGEISERWRHGYHVNFFGENWDFETSYPRAPRHMFSWSAIHRMAYEVTRDPASYDEYARIDALFGAMPTPRETAWGLGEPTYISTEDRAFHLQVVIAAEVLSELEPSKAPRYRRGMGKWWRHSMLGQRDDLLSYYFIKVDTATGRWEKLPVSVKPRPLWTSSFIFQNGTWPICMQAYRSQALTSAMVGRLTPGEAGPAREFYDRIYSDVRKKDLGWFVDPEGVLPPELSWMTRPMDSGALAIYPLAHWYVKAHNMNWA